MLHLEYMDTLSNKYMDKLKQSFGVCEHCGYRSNNLKVASGGLICAVCEKVLQDDHILDDIRDRSLYE